MSEKLHQVDSHRGNMSSTLAECLPKFALSPKQQIYTAIILYSLAAVWALLFFQSMAAILSSQKLVTSQVATVIQAIALPIVYFSLSIYCLIFALVAWRNLVATGLVAATYALGHQPDLLTLISSAIVLAAFWTFYWMFFKNMSELKLPRVAKASQHSFAFFLILMSLAIALSFYPLYAARASGVSIPVAKAIKSHFSAITAAISEANTGEAETFRSHTEHYLKARNIPVTLSAVQDHEKVVNSKLGVKGRPDEPYENVISRAIDHQVALTLRSYRVLLVIIVPLAFFFTIQTFTAFASYVILGLVFLTELVLRRSGLLVQAEPVVAD